MRGGGQPPGDLSYISVKPALLLRAVTYLFITSFSRLKAFPTFSTPSVSLLEHKISFILVLSHISHSGNTSLILPTVSHPQLNLIQKTQGPRVRSALPWC